MEQTPASIQKNNNIDGQKHENPFKQQYFRRKKT